VWSEKLDRECAGIEVADDIGHCALVRPLLGGDVAIRGRRRTTYEKSK
jgi:hypothetical protein